MKYGNFVKLAKVLLDFFEDLTNGSDKTWNEITKIYETSKKFKVEGHKEKKNGEDKVENTEKEDSKIDAEEKKTEEPTVDEDGFILVKKKGKK